jgi:hypothetical protein
VLEHIAKGLGCSMAEGIDGDGEILASVYGLAFLELRLPYFMMCLREGKTPSRMIFSSVIYDLKLLTT